MVEDGEAGGEGFVEVAEVEGVGGGELPVGGDVGGEGEAGVGLVLRGGEEVVGLWIPAAGGVFADIFLAVIAVVV